MKALGIYKKKNTKDLSLPNLYPHKASIIDQFQRKKSEKLSEQVEKLKNRKAETEMNLEKTQTQTQEFERKVAVEAV